MRLGPARRRLLLTVVAIGTLVGMVSCGHDDPVAARTDGGDVETAGEAGTADGEGPGPGPGGEASVRPDAAVEDAGPCPGMTLCGGACVQTRTDMNNCGACGAVCTATAPSTATCRIGKCITVLATTSNQPATDIALQGSYLYWTNQSAGTIQRVPIAGGAPTTLVTAQTQPHSIAADATSIYWVVNGANGIWKAPLGGGTATPVTNFSTGSIVDLAIDATTAYYTTGYGYVMSVPLAGAAVAKLVTQSNGANLAQRVAVSATHVYFTENGTNVYTAPIDGGTSTVLAISNLGIPASGLALSSTDLLWGTNSHVMTAPLAGGIATSRAEIGFAGVAFDGTDVFGFSPSGSILKVSLAGGLPQTLSYRNTPSAYAIGDIAVDNDAVYWTETIANNGYVMKISPK